MSKGAVIRDGDINLVYESLQAAISDEYLDVPVKIGHPVVLPPPRKRLVGGAPLPHPDDVRAVLRRALATLESIKPKWPEWPAVLPYLRLALHRHLDLGISLDQAFGYARVAKGAPPFELDRERKIACAVFERRFIRGENADLAGYGGGKRFGVGKTQALSAFKKHAGHARQVWNLNRLRKAYPEVIERWSSGIATPQDLRTLNDAVVWTSDEKRRLTLTRSKEIDAGIPDFDRVK